MQLRHMPHADLAIVLRTMIDDGSWRPGPQAEDALLRLERCLCTSVQRGQTALDDMLRRMESEAAAEAATDAERAMARERPSLSLAA